MASVYAVEFTTTIKVLADNEQEAEDKACTIFEEDLSVDVFNICVSMDENGEEGIY